LEQVLVGLRAVYVLQKKLDQRLEKLEEEK
jgi:hypothetical protein